MKSISFIFPHPAVGPTGGYKVVYEYANRLVADGYDVHLVYSGSIYWMQKSLRFKVSNVFRNLQTLVKGYSGRRWFDLDKRVKEHLTFSMNYRHVPKCDVYVATSPYTADYLSSYPIDVNRRFYFIQGKEDWGPGLKNILESTYHAPLNKIVVANWLQQMLSNEYSEECIVIPNGFDFNRFKMIVAPENRDRFRVSMLYHRQGLKRCQDAFDALAIVKQRFPELKVNIFGVPERPSDLPDWYFYYQVPDAETHNKINNESAIFIASSESEGWGLTVGEAMICGEAVCCTDNAGHREMAIDGQTALLSPVRNPQALANNIIKLIEDDDLRISIARNSNEYIQRFSWDRSYIDFKSFINKVSNV